MSSKDRANRARWSREQKAAVSAKFAAEIPSVEEVNAVRLSELRTLEGLMVGRPCMARTLAAVRSEIASLETEGRRHD